MPPIGGWNTGVYEIRNRVNGKVYVGSASISFGQRLYNHRVLLRGRRHGNVRLQRAWVKYGPTCFRFSIVERCSPESCVTREQFWIDRFHSHDPRYGYNICPKASSALGTVHSLASRKNMSAAHAGKPLGESHRENMIAAIREAYKNPLLLEKVARVNRERTAAETPEQRKHRCRGINKPTLSDDHRRKISIAMTGKRHSAETRRKIGLVQRGRKRKRRGGAKVSSQGD